MSDWPNIWISKKTAANGVQFDLSLIEQDGTVEQYVPIAALRALEKELAPASPEFKEWLVHYRQTTGRESVRGSSSARKAFAARLKEGRTLEELKRATVGCHGDEFCRDNGFDTPETILRASKVERYILLATEGRSTRPDPLDAIVNRDA